MLLFQVSWTQKSHTFCWMTTETLPVPSPSFGECHRGTPLQLQESSEVNTPQDGTERGTMATNVPEATAPDGSLVPSSDGAIAFFPTDNIQEEPAATAAAQKGDLFDQASSSPFTPPEGLKMATLSHQPTKGQADGHSIHQGEMTEPSSEQLKAHNNSSVLVQGEDGSHADESECCRETPDACSASQSPARTAEQLAQREEDRTPEDCPAKDPVPSTNFQKQEEALAASGEPGPEAKGIPLPLDRDTPDIDLEPPSPVDMMGEEGGIVDCHDQLSAVASESPEPLKQAACSVDNSQGGCATGASSESPSMLVLPRANSPKQSLEGCSSLASVELLGTCHTDAANPSEGLKSDSQETTETGEEERLLNGQSDLSPASEKELGTLNGQVLKEALMDLGSHTTEEPLSQDTSASSNSILPAPSLALADIESEVGPDCQQRAAHSDCDTAVPTLSPVATGDSCGPAHWGLAPVCDGQDREGLAGHESSGAGDNNKPQGEVGAKAVLESERGEKAARNTDPEEATSEPAGDQDPAAVKALGSESARFQSLRDTSEPAGPEDPAMVLAKARDGANSEALATSTRHPAATTEQAGSKPKPKARLLVGAKDSTNTKTLPNATDSICASATPVSEKSSMAGGPGCPTNGMGNAAGNPETPCPTNETPIDREIRLHLEREELLRRERGLASPRGTQEYVEVRIKPILHQHVLSSVLPNEKERQWAEVQMQREIQRECRREEDLVQLGKVRGAYDRGIPQELQEKKMIFEQQPSPELQAPRKVASNSSTEEMTRGPSFAEANSATNVVIQDSAALLQPQRLPSERSPLANPSISLRSKRPQSLLQQEVQEAQAREKELQRQRYSLYGLAQPWPPAVTSKEDEEIPFQPGKWELGVG